MTWHTQQNMITGYKRQEIRNQILEMITGYKGKQTSYIERLNTLYIIEQNAPSGWVDGWSIHNSIKAPIGQ